MFPDARFVMTHRDPTDVMVSVADLYAEVGRQFSDGIDLALPRPAQRRAVDDRHGPRCSRSATTHGDDRFYDIDFRAMQRDPIGEVRGLYAWLGEPVTDAFDAGHGAVVARRTPSDREENVHPDAAEFGLDLDEVRARFADYSSQDLEVDRGASPTTCATASATGHPLGHARVAVIPPSIGITAPVM